MEECLSVVVSDRFGDDSLSSFETCIRKRFAFRNREPVHEITGFAKEVIC